MDLTKKNSFFEADLKNPYFDHVQWLKRKELKKFFSFEEIFTDIHKQSRFRCDQMTNKIFEMSCLEFNENLKGKI